MNKPLHLVLAFLLICGTVTAQNNIAKLKYEDAEEAFNQDDYETALIKLNDAEKLFGKVNPPILYLRIMAQNQILDSKVLYSDDFNDILLSLRKNVTKYLTDFENAPNNETKYREIYKVGEDLDRYPKA